MRDLQTPAEKKLPQFRGRVWFAGILAALCFGILFARLFYLQVLERAYYTTRAESNRISFVPVVPRRGSIVDRNGTVLAQNDADFTLEIVPARAGKLEPTLDALARVVAITPKDRRRFKRLMEESKNFESIPIRNRLTDEEVARFTAQRYRFPGIEVKARLFRHYPQGELAAHALGYIGRINKADEDMIAANREVAANYRGTENIGKIGLEARYEFELHGTAGYEEVEIDASGRAERILSHKAALPGNQLILTLDAGLQKAAQDAFAGRRGALVALDPSNGAVLALVSSPSFNPNLFVDGIKSDDWDELNNDPDKPMLNRAIHSAYPPGSTFKPLMALAALSEGKAGMQYAINDPGFFDFGGRRFMDDKVGGHGSHVDMKTAIVVSCNTYFYNLANLLGIETIARAMKKLGLGEKTGIDIPSETTGVLPSPEWKQRRFKTPGQQKWYAGETISVGIGQGYNAYTPLQMAHALANVLNYGRVFRPHLVAAIRNPNTGTMRYLETEPVRDVHYKPEYVDFIKQAMAGVIAEGTGRRAFAGAPYTAGGKTGTAQVYSLKGGQYAGRENEKLRDHSWFVAFAPVDKPKIVAAVMVENGGFGAASAAPIARQVFDYYLLGKTGTASETSAVDDPDEDDGDDIALPPEPNAEDDAERSAP